MPENRAGAVVLVVDDDPVIRTLLRTALGRMGLGEVLEAADGEEARGLLSERDVDLAITDLVMPRMDGLELMRWARQARPEPDWIILSAIDTFDAAVEAIQLGAFDFIAKPPRLEDLEVSVRNALEHRRLMRERERLFLELEETTRELALKVRELEEKSEALRRDLERAEVIQRALLPRTPPSLPGWNVNALYRPGRYVGGDLYSVSRVGEDHLVLWVADATGHGVSSAMMSVLFHRRLVLVEPGGAPRAPARVLEAVNAAILEDRPGPGVFVTAALCLIDLSRGEGWLAGAGHPPALLGRPSGEVVRLERTGPALGLIADATYEQSPVRLEPGARLLLFTDGLLAGGEAPDPWPRLRALLEDPEAQGIDLLRALAEPSAGAHSGEAEDRDDVTALLLTAAPGASHYDNSANGGEGERRAPRRTGSPVLWYGENDLGSFIEVRGKGSWTEADAFLATAEGILEADRPLVVSLSRCTHLDSTFMGTLHELVSRHPRGDGAALELAEPTPEVRHELEELGMHSVLRRVTPGAAAPPEDMRPLSTGPPGGSDSRLRVLRAHEALAALSDRNRDRFHTVLETLRAELGE